jgi:hypothetical protein
MCVVKSGIAQMSARVTQESSQQSELLAEKAGTSCASPVDNAPRFQIRQRGRRRRGCAGRCTGEEQRKLCSVCGAAPLSQYLACVSLLIYVCLLSEGCLYKPHLDGIFATAVRRVHQYWSSCAWIHAEHRRGPSKEDACREVRDRRV